MAIETLAARAGATPLRIRRVQKITLTLLFIAGMVNSFSHFILLRIGLGIGEAPFMPAGVKSINDWYAQRERGTAVGIFNSSTVLGQAIAPPALVIMQLAWGWRTMFVVIGLAGIVVGLCWYVGYRNRRHFTLQEEEQQYLASEEVARPALKFSEWLALFKRRTTWGMILGFSGVNYTGWLYIAWLPGAAGVKPGPYRLGGGDPVPCGGGGDVGQWPGGRCSGAQRLRSGENPENGDRDRSGAVGPGHPAGGAILHADPGGGFYLHGAVLRPFCRDVGLGAGAGIGGRA